MTERFRPAWVNSKKAQSKLYDLYQRDQASAVFYRGAAWKRARAYKLAITPVCEEPNCTALATDVHHRQSLREFPELAYTASNLECLCSTHHLQRRKKRATI